MVESTSHSAGTAVARRALVREMRSLLQYVSDAYPWVPRDREVLRAELAGMAAERKALAGKLAELLDRRGEAVQLGPYPVEFTDTHFLSVEYLLKRLAQQERRSLVDTQTDRGDCSDDRELAALLDELIRAKSRHVARLEQLAASGGNGSTAERREP